MTQDTGVRPARPHTGVTEDGRRLAVLTSYTRRGSRLTEAQAAAWQRRHADWWIPDEAVDAPDFDPAAWFGRSAPLVVEIGSGVGEATAALAAARPDVDVLAFEVWQPGVAETFLRLEQAGAGNVRLLSVDAVWSLEHLLAPESVEELWTFFPDPWPKKRHHRRRLVGPGFARLAASRLRPGARWRLATDWPDYAEQMARVLGEEPLLVNEHDGPAPRWDERPVTKFERRGLRCGRPVTDFCFRRR
ncbi:MAG: tRNA (guanosine(46)-N7)-methyltransferase TrmB [Nocardioidaceae bacterium]